MEFTNCGIGSNVLTLSQLVRGGSTDEFVDAILAIGNPNEINDLLVLLFVTRNCRGGKGEKMLSFQIFLRVWPRNPIACGKLLPLFPLYGCWKDLLSVMATAKGKLLSVVHYDYLVVAAVALMKDQLQKDLKAVEK